MLPTLEGELLCALYALLLGLLLGLFYDGMRVTRILLGVSERGGVLPFVLQIRFPLISPKGRESAPHSAWGAILLFLCDFGYAALSGLAFCIYLYAFYDGVFRFFLLLCVVLGGILYHITIGRLLSRVCATLAYLVRILLSYLTLCVRVPLLFFLRLLLFAARALLCRALLVLGGMLAPLATHCTRICASRRLRRFFLAKSPHP